MASARRVTLPQFIREMERLPKRLEAAALRGLRSAAMRGVGIVVQEIDNTKPHPTVDTGELRNSVQHESLPDGARISVDAPHAAIMELGTRPFWPPTAPLAEWALRKGIADDEDDAEEIARAIQLHFARFGIAPRHYFRKGMQKLYLVIPEELQRELKRVQ